MLGINRWLWLFVLAMWSCSTAAVSRGGTLLYGVKDYRSNLQRAGNEVARWPERQQAANEFKQVINGLVGSSPEFYRFVDLDLRRREFMITLRETNVSPERMKEMQDQLEQMNEEIAALKPVVKSQLSAQLLHEESEGIEAIATVGLLGIALDEFSPSGSSRGLTPPSTKVGQHRVTDFGSFASVRAADGALFRCHAFGNLDTGAGVACEPGN